MIQFNLLPDVKLEYIKAERTKRLVVSVSLLAGAVALAIFLILLFTVDVVQKKNMNDLTKDIGTYGNQLKNTKDLSQILTVQSQLDSLGKLHDAKPTTSRVFAFMNQLTPTSASISKLDADFTANTITITGTADSLDTVNKFVDALKYTDYATKAAPSTSLPAFSNVVLASFGRDTTGANFSITLNFDPPLFSNASDVTLTVNTTAAAQTTAELLSGSTR